jgi:signal transduction histidine kinase
VAGNEVKLSPETRIAVVGHILRYELYRHRRLVQRISGLAGDKLLGDTARNANTWEIMFFLCRSCLEGKIPTASEVFLATELSKGTATTSLNRLDKAGVIFRTEGTDDRRQRFIHLCADYTDLLEDFVVDCHDEFLQLFSPKPDVSVAATRQELADMEQSNREKTAFMAYLSHDFRAPLNTIIGYSEAIKGELLGRLRPSGYIEYASDIYRAAHHLSDLVNDLIDLSQFEMTGTIPIQPVPVDIIDVVKNCQQMVSYDAKRKNIRLQRSIAGNLPQLVGDSARIKRAVLNLLSNAVKFTPSGGRVSIEARATPQNPAPMFIEFVVSDTGPGIPEDALHTVIKPFVHLDPTGRLAETGTGLGLAIAKSIAEAHDGSLSLKSVPGEGTHATLSLPAAST